MDNYTELIRQQRKELATLALLNAAKKVSPKMHERIFNSLVKRDIKTPKQPRYNAIVGQLLKREIQEAFSAETLKNAIEHTFNFYPGNSAEAIFSETVVNKLAEANLLNPMIVKFSENLNPATCYAISTIFKNGGMQHLSTLTVEQVLDNLIHDEHLGDPFSFTDSTFKYAFENGALDKMSKASIAKILITASKSDTKNAREILASASAHGAFDKVDKSVGDAVLFNLNAQLDERSGGVRQQGIDFATNPLGELSAANRVDSAIANISSLAGEKPPIVLS